VNYLLIYLFLFFSGNSGPDMHPIHVSVCNLELNETKSTVSFKLFKDDFALVLKNLYNEDVILENADEKKNSEIINRYINSCFQVNVNKNIRLA